MEDIYKDVMTSGYWFNLCSEIQQSWNGCVPGSEENSKLSEEVEHIDLVDECKDSKASQKACRKDESLCRNELLEYFGWFH